MKTKTRFQVVEHANVALHQTVSKRKTLPLHAAVDMADMEVALAVIGRAAEQFKKSSQQDDKKFVEWINMPCTDNHSVTALHR